jgi:hypothetical protein
MSAHDQTDWDSLVQGKTRRVKVGSISVSFDKLTRTSSDSDDFHDLQTSQDFTQLDKIYNTRKSRKSCAQCSKYTTVGITVYCILYCIYQVQLLYAV